MAIGKVEATIKDTYDVLSRTIQKEKDAD